MIRAFCVRYCGLGKLQFLVLVEIFCLRCRGCKVFSSMAEEAVGFIEAIEDRHYSKVRHFGKTGHYNFKCLLHGCPRSKPWSLRVHINTHWTRDHPGCNLQITANDAPGPKKNKNSWIAEKEELVHNCRTQSGYFPKRWMKYKREKLASKRAEVRRGCSEILQCLFLLKP